MVSEKKRVEGYKDLLVWQKGIHLAKQVYRITQVFPSEEKFGLVSPMRRAAVSIPSNLTGSREVYPERAERDSSPSSGIGMTANGLGMTPWLTVFRTLLGFGIRQMARHTLESRCPSPSA